MGIALTKEEKVFLNKYEIAPQSIMDATGLARKVYGPLLRETGHLLAWGVTPCHKHGHQLRNAHGKCVMCDTSALAFSKRHYEPGYVYVAYSPSLKRVKIGSTKDQDDRVSQLNMHNLGGCNDWVIRKSVYCSKAGQIESGVHKMLAKFQIATPYGSKDGHCRETFKCGLRAATNALREVISTSEAA